MNPAPPPPQPAPAPPARPAPAPSPPPSYEESVAGEEDPGAGVDLLTPRPPG